MVESNERKNQMKVEFGKFKLDLNGEFVKEHGKLLVSGVVVCGVVFTAGATYGLTYVVTKNQAVAKEVAGNIIKYLPKTV